ncbi:MAG: ankyrin repeat domain-containing protein [Gammaproteobacteria bacterium]|nr:ankyrin repeat domain-containing protein [Gammaproteobacteria bacterium]
MNGIEARAVELVAADAEDVAPMPDFSGHYSEGTVECLLKYYSERKNKAKVRLVIAIADKDFEQIAEFEKEQQLLGAKGEKTIDKLLVVSIIHGNVSDPSQRWSFTLLTYASPTSKPTIYYFEPDNNSIRTMLKKIIGISNSSAKAGIKISDKNDADAAIVEMARLYMQTGKHSVPSKFIIEQGRNIHAADFAKAQKFAKLLNPDGAESAASGPLDDDYIKAAPLDESRLQDMAVAAAKLGDTTWLVVLLDIIKVGSSHPVKKVHSHEDLSQHEENKKSLERIEISLAVVKAYSKFLTEVASNKTLTYVNNDKLQFEYDNSARIYTNAMFEKASELTKHTVEEFIKIIDNLNETERFLYLDNKLMPAVSAQRKLEDIVYRGVLFEREVEELNAKIEHWNDKDNAANAERNRQYERLGRQHRGINLDEKEIKNLIYNALLDINRKYEAGDTLLHLAIANKQAAAVKVLLELGAQKLILNDAGKTAVDLARELGFLPCLSIIDPEDANVMAFQGGMRACKDFIRSLKVGIEELEMGEDVRLNEVLKADPAIHLIEYQESEAGISYFRDALTRLEASCNNFNTYSTFPAFISLFNYYEQSSISTFLKIKEEIDRRQLIPGYGPKIMDILYKLWGQRLEFLKQLRANFAILFSSPLFNRMYQAAGRAMPASRKPREILDVHKIRVMGAETEAIASIAGQALIKQRNEITKELLLTNEKKMAADKTVVKLKPEVEHLKSMHEQLKGDKAALISQIEAAKARSEVLARELAMLKAHFDLLPGLPTLSAATFHEAPRPVDAMVFAGAGAGFELRPAKVADRDVHPIS